MFTLDQLECGWEELEIEERPTTAPPQNAPSVYLTRPVGPECAADKIVQSTIRSRRMHSSVPALVASARTGVEVVVLPAPPALPSVEVASDDLFQDLLDQNIACEPAPPGQPLQLTPVNTVLRTMLEGPALDLDGHLVSTRASRASRAR